MCLQLWFTKTRFIPEVYAGFFRDTLCFLNFLKLTFHKAIFHTFVIKYACGFYIKNFCNNQNCLKYGKSYTLWVPNYDPRLKNIEFLKQSFRIIK